MDMILSDSHLVTTIERCVSMDMIVPNLENAEVCTRRTDHGLSETTNQSRPSNPLVYEHKIREGGVRKSKVQPMGYSACSPSGAEGSKRGKGGSGDTDNDPDQYTEKKSFLDRS